MSDAPDEPAIPGRALSRFIATSVDLLCIIEHPGALRWLNPAWERQLGWASSELKRTGLLPLVHPADRDETEAALESLRQGQPEIRFENRLRGHDGCYRWMEWSAVPMGEEAIYGAARDITEHKVAEREAREHTRLLMMAEEVAGVGHWRIDLARDSLTWSREMYRIHGRDPDSFEPTVERAVEAYHPEDRGLVSDHIRDAILMRKDFEFELRIVRPDGTIRCVMSRGKCEVSRGGRPQAVFGVFQDVTERKRLQERVAHSERMATVGTLAAGVAHEINNPLTWVIANLDAIERTLQGLGAPEGADEVESLHQLHQMIAEAQQGAAQVERIVSDLLTYSRAKPEELQRVDLRESLEVAVSIATNQFKYRAELVRDFGQAPAVVADQSRLTQVFVNLIVNAAQAIPERRTKPGVIEVRTGLGPDGRVRVDVIDNGLGMPHEVRARVFDPFYTTKPVGEGTGLGLSISSNIVRSFGGEIEIESEEGQGTRVTVVLPAAAEPEGERVAPRGAGEGKRRVLIVDDDGLFSRAMGRLLGPDYEVLALHSARDALVLLDGGEAVDAVLCDADTADMGALEFYRNVRRVAPALGDSIAFVVGEDPGGPQGMLERAGLPLVVRPAEPARLRELVEQLVGW